MVDHLAHKVELIERLEQPRVGDVIVDIGSNEGTGLKAYSAPGLKRIGIDPTTAKLTRHYASDIPFVPDFFSA